MLTNILSVGVKRMALNPFQWCPTTGQGAMHTNEHRKFHLNMRKNCLIVRVTEQWNRLPRGVTEPPSLKLFKTCLDMVLCNML